MYTLSEKHLTIYQKPSKDSNIHALKPANSSPNSMQENSMQHKHTKLFTADEHLFTFVKSVE